MKIEQGFFIKQHIENMNVDKISGMTRNILFLLNKSIGMALIGLIFLEDFTNEAGN